MSRSKPPRAVLVIDAGIDALQRAILAAERGDPSQVVAIVERAREMPREPPPPPIIELPPKLGPANRKERRIQAAQRRKTR